MTETPSNDIIYSRVTCRAIATIIDAMMIFVMTMLCYLLFLAMLPHEESSPMLLSQKSFLLAYFTGEIITNWIVPFVVILLFWITKQATPGKMAVNAIIVDANTLQKPSKKQYLIRYFGYIISAIPLGLGYIWAIFDSKNQTWHDKLARTVVIRTI